MKSGFVHKKRTPKPEDLYADLIKAGLVKVTRRRGKPPLIEWVKPLPAP